MFHNNNNVITIIGYGVYIYMANKYNIALN